MKTITKSSLIVLVGVFLFSFSAIGCNWKKTMPKNQSTPKQVLEKLKLAADKEDIKSFRECFKNYEKYSEYIDASFHCGIVALQLQEKVVKVYGKEAWHQFTVGDENSEKNIYIALPPIGKNGYDIDNIKISGPKAEVKKLFGSKATEILERDKNGVWRIARLESISEIGFIQSPIFLNNMTKAIKKTIPLVGKDKLSASDVRKKMNDIFFKK